MIKQLRNIAKNINKAAELLEQTPNNPNIANVISENAYYIRQLEIHSASLVENIELTIKSTKP